MIDISSDVFQGLLVVISVFTGYNSVVFIFYLGNVDDNERSYMKRFTEAYWFREKILTTFNELIDKSKEIELQSFNQQNARDYLLGVMEEMEKKNPYSSDKRDAMTQAFHIIRTLILSTCIYILVSYTVALFLALIAIIFPSLGMVMVLGVSAIIISNDTCILK